MNPVPLVTPHLFIALPIADDVKLQVEERTKVLREHVSFRKWTHPQDLHITLKFLGATPSENIADIHSLLLDIAEHYAPISLSLSDLGTFGLPVSPRVLWTRVGGEMERLFSLQRDIEHKLERIGFAKENRPYSPHVTLAKQYVGADSPEELLMAIAKSTWQPPLSWPGMDIVLFESHPGKSPMYEALARFPLLKGNQ